jgi:carbamoyl-phosphate synthase large subunit
MKITVVVTGVGGGGVGEGIVKALKLVKSRYRIIATDMSPLSAPLFRVQKGYLVPPAYEKDYISSLLDICRKEKADALIPGSEYELQRISDNRVRFEENGIIPILGSDKMIKIGLDKWKTHNFLEKNGFLTPKTYLPEDVGSLLEDVCFPLLIKPRGSYGAKGIYVIHKVEELDIFTSYLKREGYDPVVQEYFDPKIQECTIGVVASKDGEIMGSISILRELKSGFSCKMIVKDYPEARENAEAIAKKIGARGPINLQCFLTETGPVTFEINPRFSGTTPIRSACGFNEVDAAIRNFLFEEKVRLNFKEGIVAVRYLNELYTEISVLDELKKQGCVVGGGHLEDYM